MSILRALTLAAIPFVALPLLIVLIVLATQTFMLTLSTIVLLGHPHAWTVSWLELKFTQSFFCLVFALPALALWHAPIHNRGKSL